MIKKFLLVKNMNNSYVILNIKPCFELLDRDIIPIDLIKIDKKMNIIDKVQFNIINSDKNKIMEFINFCKESVVIISNKRRTLSLVLDLLYKNKVYSRFNFKYINISGRQFNSSSDIYNYLNEKKVDNLDELLFSELNHGLIFRGITYPKYLCDVKVNNSKYYGYIIDLSKDKSVSYYSCLKEINGEYFNLDELKMLKEKGCVIIFNIGYLSEETLMITNYYSIVDDSCDVSDYQEYKKNNKDLRLVLWGKQTKDNSNLIDIVKEPWSYWNNDDIKIGSEKI